MFVVNAGNHHRIHFNTNPLGNQHLQAFLLLVNQNLSAFDAFNPAVFPENPRINLGADFRIDTVNGNGDVVDVVFGKLFNRSRQGKAISRYAKFNIRRILA